MENIKKFCVVSCPISTRSGYGARSRDFVRALIEARPEWDVQILSQRWGNTPMDALVPGEDDDLLSKIIMKKEDRKPNVWIQITVPNEFHPVGDYNIGVTAGVETDICSQPWVQACMKMDKVIFPSRFAMTAFVNSGCSPKKLCVVSESFYDSCLDDINEDVVNLDNVVTSKNFLMFGQITGADSQLDRKNTFDTIKWFVQKYHDKPYGLIIKTNHGTNCKLDKNITKAKLSSLIKQIRPEDSKLKVYLLHGSMSEKEVAGLYKSSKLTALISATRGEGFGLPLLEAAACGLPVVATNWSGHKDFLDLGKWFRVNKSLVNVHPHKIDGNIFVPGARWAQPDAKDFVKQIDLLLKDEEEARSNARQLQERIATQFCFTKLAEDYDQEIGAII